MSLMPGVSIGAMNITTMARIGDLLAHVLAEEVVVGERRVGGHHLGARDVDAGVGLLLDGDVDVLDLLRPACCGRWAD